MLFFNSDGSVGEMCGNGARCICRYGFEHGYAGSVQRVETTAGLVTGWRIADDQYRIRLNTPAALELQKPLDVDGRTYRCSYVELGDPGIPHLAVQTPGRTKPRSGSSAGSSGPTRRCRRARTSTSTS